MPRVLERLRAFLQQIGPRNALAGAIALLALSLLVLSLAVIWFGVLSSRQQTAEQAAMKEGTSTQKTGPEESPLVFGPGPSEFARGAPADARSPGIPGLGEMDVIGSLQYLPGTDFRCPGGSPDRGLIKRVCKSSSDDSATYEVTVMERNPTSVLWVEATAYDASEEEAAKVLSYVAKLSLQDTDPLNAEAWVNRNVSTGGQYFAGGAELRLYGTERARTLEIVASGLPTGPSAELTEATAPRGFTVPTISLPTTTRSPG